MTRYAEEKEPAFKVVDRRRFTEEGEERVGDEPRQDVEVNSKEAASTSTIGGNNSQPERPVMSFSLFIQSLAHQAMMALGIMPWPDSGLIKKELKLAKETIDILQILKEKTAGNLSDEEKNLLDTIVYQLQVAYVEMSNLPEDGKGAIIK
jgi:hypothetical protein